MIAFADLVDRLVHAPGPDAKRAWLRHYFGSVADPDRGWALAAVAGRLGMPAIGAGVLRALAARRCEPTLFAMSHEYVGDLAEALALMWPASGEGAAPRLGEVVAGMRETPKPLLPVLIEAWLDVCGPAARLVLLKLVTGHLAPAVDLALAKATLAEMTGGRVSVADIEEVWHMLAPPYEKLFAWVEGRGARPLAAGARPFHAPMLAATLDERAIAAVNPDDDVAEWLWSGLRVQVVTGPRPVLLSREGEDIGAGFPGIIVPSHDEAVLDGMLLVAAADVTRLRRGKGRARGGVSALLRLHDMLFEGSEDLRALPLGERRLRLEAWFARTRPAGADLSPLLTFRNRDELLALREEARARGALGVVLKRRDAPYVGGRVPGAWRKLKPAPLTFAAVLMYAEAARGQAGAITAGVWDGGRLVPLGRAENRLGARDRVFLDAWIAEHALARFGPVREVELSLVLKLTCDGVEPSRRSRAGLALRQPRIVGLCRECDAARADTLAGVAAWVRPDTSPAVGAIATA